MDDKTKESLNRFLTEWMGECWHDLEWMPRLKGKTLYQWECLKCKKKVKYAPEPPDWTSRSLFLDLWDKAMESKEWTKFQADILQVYDLIAQPTFAEEFAKFLGWKED